MNSLFRHSIGLFILTLSTVSLVSCKDNVEDGSRAFMCKATVTGNAASGYTCYLDGGGLVLSQDPNLEGVERGYFAFHYMETDWTSSSGISYIRNAHVLPQAIFEIVRPTRIDEAENDHDSATDQCQEPPLLSLETGGMGYFDLNTGIRIFNHENGESVPVSMDLMYDPAEQTPDTLRLDLCYRPEVPAQWTNTSVEYGSVSCDISSLADLMPWSDSVTIAVRVAPDKRFMTRISKNGFSKPVPESNFL